MDPFKPKGLKRLRIPRTLINEDNGLIHACFQNLPQKGFMEDAPPP